MFRLALLAAVAGVTLASCPNQCSGHGWCDENDRCICFRAPGTANQHLAYIGADCSQRVCPYGRTHDLISDSTQELVPIWADPENPFVGFDGSGAPKLKAFLNNGFLLDQDLGLDVRVVSVPEEDVIKFQWKLSNQKTFGVEVTAYSPESHTQTLYTSRPSAYHVRPNNKDSGLYIYFDTPTKADVALVKPNDRYFINITFNDGVSFIRNDPNSAHQLVECSGRGICDRSNGACQCVDGYTGDACQRTVCPNDCSGHGICQSEKYFVLDAVAETDISSVTYTGFDAESAFGCKCDSGFRGADCSHRECPSGPDPMKGDGGAEGMDCSGRGLCDYTTGICKCFKGFYGERCEELTTLV